VEFLFTGDFPVWFPRDVYDVISGVKEVVDSLVEEVNNTGTGDCWLRWSAIRCCKTVRNSAGCVPRATNSVSSRRCTLSLPPETPRRESMTETPACWSR